MKMHRTIFFITEYKVVQKALDEIEIFTDNSDDQLKIVENLKSLFNKCNCEIPRILFTGVFERNALQKLKRIECRLEV